MENKENHFEGFDDKIEIESNSAILYERSRIKALSEQREGVQKKTFTNWINAHLSKCQDISIVKDLFQDLQDGRVLLRLLEIISGEKLPNPSKGKMRIHCLENLVKSLNFLEQQHVYLENLGAHDIVDGNQTLTLGLIWTLILRFQIQQAIPDQTDEPKTSKEALLLWSQMKTAGYPNVNIKNFTTSWKDGLAFNAILHKHDPDVVDFVSMTKANPLENLNTAFEVAENKYGVPRLLDANDIAVEQPDERSIMTYVGVLSNTLNKLKDDNVKSKRLQNFITKAMSIDEMKKDYENGCSDLLDWILSKINFMDTEEMGQSLPELKDQLSQFTNYRLEEKPPKFIDRSVLEMDFFEIQTKLRNDNRKIYIAPEGKLISDINRAWEDLESAEHRMEMKLYDELIRQEKLDQLGHRFNRKAVMRETWLHENDRLVHQSIFGDNLVTVVAAIKKHEALEGDIYAHEGRIDALGDIVEELDKENYYKVKEIKNKFSEIKDLWEKLLEDLQNRRTKLDKCRDIQLVLHETDHLLDWINDIGSRLQAKDFGKHLQGVEDLLEKHKILSSDIRNLDNRIVDVANKITNCDFDSGSIDPEIVKKRDDLLNDSYKQLLNQSSKREEELLKYKTVWQLIEELDNDKEWIKEINQLMQNPDIGHDLASVERLIRKHDQICSDVQVRKDKVNKNLDDATQNQNQDDSRDRRSLTKEHIDEVFTSLRSLDILIEERAEKLQDSLKFYQLLADIDDTDVMIVEERRMFESIDVGDKQSMTEFYLKQLTEQMIQVDFLKNAVVELRKRQNDLTEGTLDSEQERELEQAVDNLNTDFNELLKLTDNRRHLLENTLTKFNLLNDIDTIETWIVAKEKFLETLVPTEEIDELNVIKHRFDCFIDQMKLNSEKLSQINDMSAKLVDNDHPESQTIATNQSNINEYWNKLADITAEKQKELDRSLSYNQFLIECQETCFWIDDKKALLEWTDDLTDDLNGIMQLQRRLGSLQRDVQAVEAKVDYLNEHSVELKVVKPAAEKSIDADISNVNEHWAELKKMLQDRDSRLNSSNDLQKFLQDLDSFNVWLTNKQREVASQDIPNNLQEAEKLFSEHQQIREEIDCWIPEFSRLLQFGRNLSGSNDDSQHLLFNQRLNGLEEGWQMLQKMCDDKDVSLRQSIDAQTFIRDALQVDGMLTKQETFLAKEDKSATIEVLENHMREFQTFKATVASNQPKIESVLSFGDSLVNNNALSDKISNKCEQIRDRCEAICLKIDDHDNSLQDELQLKVYLEDVMDLEEWIDEKMITATDTSYREDKDISTRYNRFKAFKQELEASKDKVDDVLKAGEDLIEKCPQLEPQIEPKRESLSNLWSDLMTTAEDKLTEMEDANRERLFDESLIANTSWVTEVSSQIITTEMSTENIGLTEINELAKYQQLKDNELEEKKRILDDNAAHAIKLAEQYPDRQEEFEQKQQEVRIKLVEVEAMMTNRRQIILQHKTVQQFLRDLQDEKEWIKDKLDFVDRNKVSPESLQVCLQKIRRLKTLATEIDNHESRIDDLKTDAKNMIDENHPKSEAFDEKIQELDSMWSDLLESLNDCQTFFANHQKVHEYLTDASESEIWMSEREFDLMKEERTKDVEGSLNAMRRHEELTNTIQNYSSDICELGDRSRAIVEEELQGWHAVAQRQERVDKMYAGLLDMCLDRKIKIEDLIKIHRLLLSIQDLEEWIAERTVVASSGEVGSEFEHCNLLRERMTEFATETNDMGGPRVAEAMDMCDRLIEQGHQEAAEIARWKDRVNEAWADLLELIETRIQLLKCAWDFFKFMSESAEILDRIHEKVLLIPDGLGKDAKMVASYQRKHAAFMLEINSFKPHVDTAIETATHLLPFYCGPKEDEILERRLQLQKLWFHLVTLADNRNNSLMDGTDFFRFLAMIRELLAWMTDIEKQLQDDDKARDVCGVELIMSNHRSLKAEIDSRDENRSICVSLGRSLIGKRHPSRDDIRHKCAEVVAKHFNIKEDWLEKQEHLDMILEVYQFARDAAVAESWLMAQEPQVQMKDVGDNLTDTLNLIQKHQTLERTLSTQEERFDSLKKVTSFEEKSQSLTEDMRLAKKKEREEQLRELILEFVTPPPTPKEISRQSSEVDVVIEEESVVPVMATVAFTEQRDTDTKRREEISKSEPREFPPLAAEPKPMSCTVNRKHEWETPTKKASNRAWHSFFVVLDDNTLSFYKNEKTFKDDKSNTHKHEKPLILTGAIATVATSYKKRLNTLRLRLKEGSDYLLQTQNQVQMTNLVDAINLAGGVDQSKLSSTLPAPSTTTSDFDSGAQGKMKFPTLIRKK